MKTVKRRSYSSARRREQAQATRASVEASARRLFAENGYAATSIEAIARDAGIAVQTFYATYGSKRAVLLATLDAADVESDVERLRQELAAAASDAPRQLALLVAFAVGFYEQHAELVAIARSAGDSEPDLAELWREGEARRRRGQAPIVRAWARSGALRRGLEARDAADVLWSLTGADAHRTFVKECRWTPKRYQAWLVRTLEEVLLEKGRRAIRPPR